MELNDDNYSWDYCPTCLDLVNVTCPTCNNTIQNIDAALEAMENEFRTINQHGDDNG